MERNTPHQSGLKSLLEELEGLSLDSTLAWIIEYSHSVQQHGDNSIFTLIGEGEVKRGIPGALNTISRLGFPTIQELAAQDLPTLLAKKRFTPNTKRIISALWEEARSKRPNS